MLLKHWQKSCVYTPWMRCYHSLKSCGRTLPCCIDTAKNDAVHIQKGPSLPPSSHFRVGNASCVLFLQVNGCVVTHFLPLEEVLDERAGGSVTLVVERGGQRREPTLKVGGRLGVKLGMDE